MTPPTERTSPEEVAATICREPAGWLQDVSPEMCMVISMFVPGAGHAVLGLWRIAIVTAVTFTISALLTLLFASGSIDARSAGGSDLFFTAVWITVAVWFFAIGDAWHAARKPATSVGDLRLSPGSVGDAAVEDGLNPRVAFVLNFCTRGLGYFYVDRPWLGALSIVGWALFFEVTCRAGQTSAISFSILAVQTAMGLHAYSVASRRGRPPHAPIDPTRTRRLLTPAAILLAACLLALQAVSAAVERLAQSNDTAASRQQGSNLRLEDDGLRLTLPTADWHFEAARSGNSIGAFTCSRARIVLLRARAGDDLDGFIVNLAGEMSKKYGPLRLTDQHPFKAGGVNGRELCIEWNEGGMLSRSHLILIPHGDAVHVLIVEYPQHLADRTRDEVERLVGSFQFAD